MYLDAGKNRCPAASEETVRNLREVSPTVYFNVPEGVTNRCCPYLRDDKALARQILRAAWPRDVLLRCGAVALSLEQSR